MSGISGIARAQARGLFALACAVAVCCGVAAGLAGAARAETVRSFEAEIHLGDEDRFTVVERIAYDFESSPRHGIYREIPVAYGRGRAADYQIRVEIEEATMNGAPVEVQTSRSGSDLRVRIGDPDRTITGRHLYEIRYTVRRGLLFFDAHDEVYWNVNGFGWAVPIERIQATVYAPVPIDGRFQHTCYTGPRGSFAQDCGVRVGEAALTFVADNALRSGENLTIVLGLPKGIVREPTGWERFWSRVGDYFSFWLLLPFGAIASMIALWRDRGRDPGGKAAIDVRYEPPEGLTPAEVGTVIDERVDMVDITSTLIDLAVRGHLRIEEQEEKGFLFLKKRDWRLERLEGRDGLRGHEKLLLDRLFSIGASATSVEVSALKNRFHQHLPEIEDEIYREVSREDGFFPTSPDGVRKFWVALGAAGIVLGMLMFGWSPQAGIGVGLTGAIALAFYRAMPRKTRRGVRAHQEILGYQEFLGRVDRDRLERMGTRTIEAFERSLPFAVVLGVADEWAEAFGDLYDAPPDWYASPRYGSGFDPGLFVSDIGTSMDTIGQSMASQPRQSGSGSGSSGFGGGGFSGGGFGGGGGGSW